MAFGLIIVLCALCIAGLLMYTIVMLFGLSTESSHRPQPRKVIPVRPAEEPRGFDVIK